MDLIYFSTNLGAEVNQRHLESLIYMRNKTLLIELEGKGISFKSSEDRIISPLSYLILKTLDEGYNEVFDHILNNDTYKGKDLKLDPLYHSIASMVKSDTSVLYTKKLLLSGEYEMSKLHKEKLKSILKDNPERYTVITSEIPSIENSLN